MWIAIGIGVLLLYIGGIFTGLRFRKGQPAGDSPSPAELAEIVEMIKISKDLGKTSDEIIEEINELIGG